MATGSDQPRTHHHVVQLLEGAAPYEGAAEQMEFSRGTWRRKCALSHTLSSGGITAVNSALTPVRADAGSRFLGKQDMDGHIHVLRRTWTDMDFDNGEEMNQRLVELLETEFAVQLASSMDHPSRMDNVETSKETRKDSQTVSFESTSYMFGKSEASIFTDDEVQEVLSKSHNLGASLDIIGVYLKNYMTDKADLVLRRVMPLCRHRGGFWLIKVLNIASCVYSKQGRHDEALKALVELDSLVRARLAEMNCDDTSAWGFYDMIYKNFGWTLQSLGRNAEAFNYFERAVEIKRANGIAPTWFDQWDLGRALLQMAYEQQHAGELSQASRLLCDALKLQQRSDPNDMITRGKLLKSNGDCRVALGALSKALQDQLVQWAEAEGFFREARACFQDALGASNPLTGWASQDLAGILMRLRRWREARDMLHQALHCECCKDIIELPNVYELIEGLILVHRKLGHADRPNKKCYESDVLLGLANLRNRRIDEVEPASFAALLMQASHLLGVCGLFLQEAAACLQLAWEQGPERKPNPTFHFDVQTPVRPQFMPPRAQIQGLKVSFVALLSEFEAEIAALQSKRVDKLPPDTAVDIDSSVSVCGRFVALD